MHATFSVMICTGLGKAGVPIDAWPHPAPAPMAFRHGFQTSCVRVSARFLEACYEWSKEPLQMQSASSVAAHHELAVQRIGPEWMHQRSIQAFVGTAICNNS